MANVKSENKVYSEFLTNLAVAWFSAGIIAPLFTPGVGIYKAIYSIIAVIACFISLRLATLFI